MRCASESRVAEGAIIKLYISFTGTIDFFVWYMKRSENGSGFAVQGPAQSQRGNQMVSRGSGSFESCKEAVAG